ELVRLQSSAIRLSRPVLLGSRTPGSQSCVTVVKPGELNDKMPDVLADWDGGPGTRLELLLIIQRRDCRTPRADFTFHQTRLRTYLRNQLIANERALDSAAQFADQAQALANRLAVSENLPADLVFVPGVVADDWTSVCLDGLNRAVASQNHSDARRWSTEL